ncbi:MAG TPA: CARDB domain-containing protein [Candidatus Nitrosotenuis sp.]|nr:CARDB domain-containing protein [Candidatus Nitrosotenuis sp.]
MKPKAKKGPAKTRLTKNTPLKKSLSKKTPSKPRSVRRVKKKSHSNLIKYAVASVVIILLGIIGAYTLISSNAATPLVAGHVPGRVLLGMAATEEKDKFPKYAEALQITGPVYERRIFKPSWITASAMTGMLDECAAKGQYCVISFKVPNNDWAGVNAGKYDQGLEIAKTVARNTSKPFAFGIHHEPTGDGVAREWAAMQEYLVTYLSPVNDKMAFTTIANGFLWGPNRDEPDSVLSSYYPDSLISKMNQYKGIMAADFYDTEPLADGTYKARADRTSMKIQGFVDWARRKGVKAIGAGEFGTTTGAELTNSWKVMKANSDFFVYANYFNSPANSRWDWRLLLDSYPVTMPNDPNDRGGTPESEARLRAFQAAVRESAGTTITAPTVPANVNASVADTSVTLSWSASTDSNGTITGYEVRHKATSSTSWGTPVAVTGAPHTVTGLKTGTSYDFQVRAKDNNGTYSVYTATKTVTPIVTKPDFVLTSLTWTPANPVVGQQVTFSATIKNQGNGASAAGTIHGVSFYVDGKRRTWSDNHTASLAPGASVTVTANGGPTGSATWAATSGSHSIEAFVDAANRTAESNETNNKMAGALTSVVVPPPADPADTQKPTQPSKPYPSLVTRTQIALIWGSSTDNTRVVGYNVYRNNKKIASPTTTAFTDSNLSAGTSYTYQVSAYDAAGNESNRSFKRTVTTNSSITSSTSVLGLAVPPNTDQPLEIVPDGQTIAVSVPANEQPVISGAIKLNNTSSKDGTTKLSINGKVVKTVNGTAADLDTTTLQDGVHTVTLTTTDSQGAETTTSRYVTVDNDLNLFEQVRNFVLQPFAGSLSANTMSIVFVGIATALAAATAATGLAIRRKGLRNLLRRK